MTCRQLIVKRDGKRMLQPVALRDWPDYKYRQNGAAFAETMRVARRACEKQTRFLQRLNELMPEDIFICIREAERPHVELARAA